MVRAQLDGHIPVYDPSRFPKFDQVAEPDLKLVKVQGEHYWVRLTDNDLYLSCMWCGQVRPWDDDIAACPGRPRVDILHAPVVFDTPARTAETAANEVDSSAAVENITPF